MSSSLREIYKESNGFALLVRGIPVLLGVLCLYDINEQVRNSSLRGKLPDIIDYANHCGNIEPSMAVVAPTVLMTGAIASVILRDRPSRKAAAVVAGIGAAVGIGFNVAVEVEPFAPVVAPEFNSGHYYGGDPIDLGYGAVTSIATSLLLARTLGRRPAGYDDAPGLSSFAMEATSIPELPGPDNNHLRILYPPID